ncbi:hypothetical protein NP233_g7799 [Leucocoprinus birnbaumii]|uniref:NACHT domain-containing protein n=1 Tax=Leucocoprinus birnbaumii TaxID=56174 RepID=A0AAD5VNG5_9AGAR|nr:hypothetical protein NP233_g7799 [Leucocoprinus birnbaumii]
MADDPQPLRKAMHLQFKRLIADPFSTLHLQGHASVRRPFLVVLDGLDECADMRAQRRLVAMIVEFIRLKHGLSLLWLICSRPESHLKRAFWEIPECGRLELLLDRQSRDDVERFLRESLANIQSDNSDIIPSRWPAEAQIATLLRASSGLFAVAAIAIRFIDDTVSEVSNPMERLNALVSYFGNVKRLGTKFPLVALDHLYSQILSSIPKETFRVTRRILGHLPYRFSAMPRRANLSAQSVCNLLQYDQFRFYNALRGLHSIIDIPPPEEAAQRHLKFYHCSFHDFLLDPSRSGTYALEPDDVFAEEIESYMLWHQSEHSTYLHDAQRWPDQSFSEHQDRTEPPLELSWASPQNREKIVEEITEAIYSDLWFGFLSKLANGGKGDKILTLISSYDFRRSTSFGIRHLARWLNSHYPSNNILRTEPAGDKDLQLLEYLRVIGSAIDVPNRPATFSRNARDKYLEYFFVGYGEKAGLVVSAIETGVNATRTISHILSIGHPPSEMYLADHRRWLENDDAEYRELMQPE